MRLWIASDHAGFPLKQELIKESISGIEIEWIDLGPMNTDSVDYPQYAETFCRELIKGTSLRERLEPCGVLICGSGVGMSMAANRNIRAVLALREDVAKLSREHNASNVLCLGARLVSPAEARKIFKAWIETPFEGGRHEKRVKQMDEFRRRK